MKLSILGIIKRILEELVPFVFFLPRARRKLKSASDPRVGNKDGAYENYHKLEQESLKERLIEEHKRAKAIDEKTVKLTFAISLGLSVLGTTSTFLTKTTTYHFSKLLIAILTTGSVFYTLTGGLLALGALKTLPTYGFGTDFRLKEEKGKESIVGALAAQEQVNIIRHLRNESAYQSLRNGLLCLLLGLTIFGVSQIIGINSKNSLISKTSTQEIPINKKPAALLNPIRKGR